MCDWRRKLETRSRLTTSAFTPPTRRNSTSLSANCSDSSRLVDRDCRQLVANLIHTADAPQLDSWVASASAVCIGLKEIVSTSATVVWAQCTNVTDSQAERQTERSLNGNSTIVIGEIDYQSCSLERTNINKKARAAARKPRDAEAILFGLKFANDIHYTLSCSQASIEQGFGAPNIDCL